jgi:hypothetical protein
MMNGTKLYAGLLAGSAIGVLSSLPFVNLANCCCLWIFGGGMLASYLYQQNQDEPIAVSDALAVGAIAAVCAAVVGLVVSIPINYVTAPILQRVVARALESSQDVPTELRDVLENVSMSGAGLVASFVLWLVVYLFVVPAGALIGGLMFQKKAIAPAAPPAEPAATDLGMLPLPPSVTPLLPVIGADELGPQSTPAATAAEDASWDEAPVVLPEDTTPAAASHSELVPPADTPQRAIASADTASEGPAPDAPDDDDLPPSSTPPSQPPPLPPV